VFSLCADPGERLAFLDRLVDEAGRRTVLVALRADRLADVAVHPGFSRLVEGGMHLVGALDEAGLREVVEGPARQAGLLIEPGLVDLLAREVRDDPGALPLLSHALLETWRRREGNTLTVAGYRDSGGIHGAVAQSAERLYAEVDIEHRQLLRDLVLRLVSPGTEGEPVLTRVPRRLVATDHDHDRLIELLVGARLVTSDDGVLEITHEALARAWPRLRGWLDDDIEGQRILHHLSGAADAWDSLGRPDSELYRGVRLARALDWQQRTHTALTRAETDFLDAARVASEAEERSAAERARAQARLIARLRVVLTGAVILLVLALAAGGIAAVQSNRAQSSASAARAAEGSATEAACTALARGAAAKAAASDDIDTALLLGAAAVRMEKSAETVSSLTSTLAEHPALLASTPLTVDEPMTLDLHPDGRHVAVLDALHRVQLLDRRTGEPVGDQQVGPPRNESEEVRPLRFSPDGSQLAVARTSLTRRPVALLDPLTLDAYAAQPAGLPAGDWQAVGLGFSQDSSRLVAVVHRFEREDDSRFVAETRAFVWQVAEPTRPRASIDLTNPTSWASAALSPDGRILYTVSPELRRHDLATVTPACWPRTTRRGASWRCPPPARSWPRAAASPVRPCSAMPGPAGSCIGFSSRASTAAYGSVTTAGECCRWSGMTETPRCGASGPVPSWPGSHWPRAAPAPPTSTRREAASCPPRAEQSGSGTCPGRGATFAASLSTTSPGEARDPAPA
jgi:conflict system STAND superfamily ATPase